MKQRKINDSKLLELLREDKPQKEIARIFNCSEPAISKRLKRLLPPPESLEKLTPKEQRFCIEKASGHTATESAMKSFDTTNRESGKVIGSQLMSKTEIRTAICDLMDYHGLSRSFRIQKLKGHVDNRDPSVSLKALDMSLKLADDYPKKETNVEVYPTKLEFKVVHAHPDEETINITPGKSGNDESEDAI